MVPVAELYPDGVLLVNALTVTNGTTSSAQQLQWPCDGYLVGISTSTYDFAVASLASMQLRVVVDGNTDYFTTGTANAFLPFAHITNTGFARWPTRKSFRQGTPWQAYVKNVSAGSLTCDLGFWYVNVANPRL